MSIPGQYHEASLARIANQRRIAYRLIQECRNFLQPGIPFAKRLAEIMKDAGRFGSKDRRLYRELLYTYLRFQPWLDEESEAEACLEKTILLAHPTKEIISLYPSLSRVPSVSANLKGRLKSIGRDDEREFPKLLPPRFSEQADASLSSADLALLFQRPPLWLRVQRGNSASIAEACNRAKREGDTETTLHSLVPSCLQAPADLPLSRISEYEQGCFEVQDISSQALLHLLPSAPEGRWLDACAGAGGKTLQLASMLAQNGEVVAHDLRQDALDELKRRQAKAGLSNIKIQKHVSEEKRFDGVLVDAPCSASGTWRRHPFLMRQAQVGDATAYSKKQIAILEERSRNVEKGGTLLYATCSLYEEENQDVQQRFLEKNGNLFEYLPLAERFGKKDAGHGIFLTPSCLNGDALYIAAFRRKHD